MNRTGRPQGRPVFYKARHFTRGTELDTPPQTALKEAQASIPREEKRGMLFYAQRALNKEAKNGRKQ